MKINELLNEAPLPGVKQSLWSKMFGSGNGDKEEKQRQQELAAQREQYVNNGTKAWINVAKQLTAAKKLTVNSKTEQYAAFFKHWATLALEIKKDSPAVAKIAKQLAIELKTDNSVAPIQKAIGQLVDISMNLKQNQINSDTAQTKVDTVLSTIKRPDKYGKYIKSIEAEQAIEKYLNNVVKQNPDIDLQELYNQTKANLAKIIKTPTPRAKTTKPAAQTKPTATAQAPVPDGSKVNYVNTEYTWVNNAWRDAQGNVLTGSDAEAATNQFRNPNQ